MELSGKIINFLGDSITEGYGVQNLQNRFDNVIIKKHGLKAVYNYGIGGTRIAHQSVPSNEPRFDLCMCGRAYDLNKDADVVVVFAGTNDYGHGDAPFGALSDKTPHTFCGGVDFLINILKEKHPDAKIVFVTPAHRVGDKEKSKAPEKRDDAKPLCEYVEVIKTKASEYGLVVLDLFNTLGIDPNNEIDKQKYTTDGLHFNDEGHAVIAETIAQFLLKL